MHISHGYMVIIHREWFQQQQQQQTERKQIRVIWWHAKYFRISSPSRIYELYSFTSTRSGCSIIKNIAFYRVWLVEEELIVKFNFTLTHIQDGVYIQLCASSRPSSSRRCCLMYAFIIKQIQALCLDFAYWFRSFKVIQVPLIAWHENWIHKSGNYSYHVCIPKIPEQKKRVIQEAWELERYKHENTRSRPTFDFSRPMNWLFSPRAFRGNKTHFTEVSTCMIYRWLKIARILIWSAVDD